MYNIRLPLECPQHVEEGSRKRVVDYITAEMDARGTYVAVFECAGKWWVRVSGQVYLGRERLCEGGRGGEGARGGDQERTMDQRW